MNIQTFAFLFLALTLVLFVPGCSYQPPVEKEVVQQNPTPVPLSDEPEEPIPPEVVEGEEVAEPSGGSSSEIDPATPEATDLKAGEGARLVKAGSQMSGGELQLLVPTDWPDTPARSRMRLLQVAIPAGAEGAGDGELTVFYFGPNAGTIQMNIDRWIGQFSQPDGTPSKDRAKIEEARGKHHSLTIVDLSGTMSGSSMPGMAETPERAGWRLLACIVMTPSGPWFIKATGPEATMEECRGAFVEMCTSAKFLARSGEPGSGTVR